MRQFVGVGSAHGDFGASGEGEQCARVALDAVARHYVALVNTHKVAFGEHGFERLHAHLGDHGATICGEDFHIVVHGLDIEDGAELHSHILVFYLDGDFRSLEWWRGTVVHKADGLLHLVDGLLKAGEGEGLVEEIDSVEVEAVDGILCIGSGKHQECALRYLAGKVHAAHFAHLVPAGRRELQYAHSGICPLSSVYMTGLFLQ